MPVIQLLIILIIIGALLYVINRVVPMDEKIKTIVNVLVVILVLLWLLDLFGFGTGYVVGRHR